MDGKTARELILETPETVRQEIPKPSDAVEGRPEVRDEQDLAGRSERLFGWILKGGGISILALFGVVLLVCLVAAWPSIHRFGLSFLWSSAWNPNRKIFGAFPYLVGTLWVTGIAMITSIPVAIFSALFLSDYAPPWLSGIVSTLMEMLAGIPSIVFGAFGITFMVPFCEITWNPILPRRSENDGTFLTETLSVTAFWLPALSWVL